MWYEEEKCNFLKVFLQNIWWERKFCIPLHSLYKTSHLASCLKHIKKEFFEKIYINREVVQEASVWFYIKWMGKRNEPINSLSCFWGTASKLKEQKKRCFLLDTFRISVLKQRLLGEVFGLTWYSLSLITYHLSPKHILQWRVWSWLRMNASYRLNTCKSRGNGIECLHSLDVDRRTGE